MKALAGIASVLCCASVVPVIADAKIRRPPTQITLTEADAASIRGVLSSSFKGCASKRLVRFVDPGTGGVFHTTRTDRDGGFSIALGDIPAGAGTVTVQTAPKRVGNRICEDDTANLAFNFATLDGGPVNGAFGGVLFSNIEACEPNRLISLYEISADPAFAGSALTNASGAWTIAAATGFWEARADATLAGGGDSFTYCPAVTSNPWFYEEPPPEESP